MIYCAHNSDDSMYKEVNMTDIVQDLRAGWTEFEFDLAKESKDVESNSMSVGVEVEASYNNIAWGVGGDKKHNEPRAHEKEYITEWSKNPGFWC